MLTHRRYSLEQWIRLYTVVIVVSTLGAIGIGIVQGQTILYKPYLRFSDFTVYMEKTRHPIGNGETIVSKFPQMNYPAPAIFVYSAFANLPGDPLSWFVALLLAGAIGGALLLEGLLRRAGITFWTRWSFAVASVLTSYPLWIEIDRANIEGVIWIVLSVGMIFFAQRRFLAAGIFIALAGAIKPFPLILFGIFLAHNLYKELLLSSAVWIIVTVAAFIGTSGTLPAALNHYLAGTNAYQGSIAVAYRAAESNFDHSLFCAAKQVLRLAVGFKGEDALNAMLVGMYRPYLAVVAVGFLICCLVLRRRPLMNQVVGAFTLMTLLPPSNYDYTLLNLYVPFAFFITILIADEVRTPPQLSNKLVGTLLLSFAILFTSQTFLHLTAVGVGGQIKAMALLALLFAALCFPMHSFSKSKMLQQAP